MQGAIHSSSSASTLKDNEREEEHDDLNDVLLLLRDRLTLHSPESKPFTKCVRDVPGIAEFILSGRAKNIVVMCGAGISVSAGIPDFRSPGTGLYSRLQEFKLPYPQAVFEIDFFKKRPDPFYTLAKELFPGKYAPTTTHHFIKLLHDKGLLLRCFTQNIDSLEHATGLPKDMVVAAHGNFDAAHCISCKQTHDVDIVKKAIMEYDGQPMRCGGKNKCNGLVKPAIVFFGENLPDRFHQLVPQDFSMADLLIVLGTSLVVQPFASLIDKVPRTTPRLLINRERVGETDSALRSLGIDRGFNFDQEDGRDALFLGDCDEGVRVLCQHLGWHEELDALMTAKKRHSEESK